MPISTPKIRFQYSSIYNKNWKTRYLKGFNWEPDEKKFDWKSTEKYPKKISQIWKLVELRVLREMARVSGLQWSEREVICYIVAQCVPFSEPMTIAAIKNKQKAIDTIVHEMIHNLFMQKGNWPSSEESWKWVHKTYANFDRSTRIHILLHAIHKHLYLKLFTKKEADG